MNPRSVLMLPGWQNSGPLHWQSRWEAAHGYQRVDQHDWLRPLRGDWISRLEDVLLTGTQDEPVVLVAHSLGCQLVAAWASHSKNTHRVKAALLVAPGDPEREALRPVLPSWSPAVMQRLPFACVLIGSQNDPYCRPERARQFADAWGADWVSAGAQGHLNADSQLGDWPEGHAQLQTLRVLVQASQQT
ncbi:MAG: alpha/beta fold hydrolase [Polaromonas sp.]|nr:alpha/beta fold hydrolase [Polaromonas sp.]